MKQLLLVVGRPTLERQSEMHAHSISAVLWPHVHGCVVCVLEGSGVEGGHVFVYKTK